MTLLELFRLHSEKRSVLKDAPIGCKFFPSLRKHAYSNILKILPPIPENFQIKNSDSFHISAQNIDCGTC